MMRIQASGKTYVFVGCLCLAAALLFAGYFFTTTPTPQAGYTTPEQVRWFYIPQIGAPLIFGLFALGFLIGGYITYQESLELSSMSLTHATFHNHRTIALNEITDISFETKVYYSTEPRAYHERLVTFYHGKDELLSVKSKRYREKDMAHLLREIQRANPKIKLDSDLQRIFEV